MAKRKAVKTKVPKSRAVRAKTARKKASDPWKSILF